MSCESLSPLLPLLLFHQISLAVFIVYILLSIKKKTKIPYLDLTLYLFTLLAWGVGFYLSDRCVIGFGKTMGNFSEILLIGILMLIYMLTKFIYLLCESAAIPRKISCFMAGAAILASFFIGILVPGLPE